MVKKELISLVAAALVTAPGSLSAAQDFENTSLENRVSSNYELCNNQIKGTEVGGFLSQYYPISENQFPGRYILNDLVNQGGACEELAFDTEQLLRSKGYFPNEERVSQNVEACIESNPGEFAVDFLHDFLPIYQSTLQGTYYLGSRAESQLGDSDNQNCIAAFRAFGIEDLGSNSPHN